MKNFMEFIRTQGVVGLAVGLILGGAVSEVVKSILEDLVNPIIGLVLNTTEGLKEATFTIAGATVRYGDFISTLINFIVICLVVYFGVKKLGLDKLDKKTDK